jgi:hypothetical protein
MVQKMAKSARVARGISSARSPVAIRESRIRWGNEKSGTEPNARFRLQLLLLGSNQDSPDPEAPRRAPIAHGHGTLSCRRTRGGGKPDGVRYHVEAISKLPFSRAAHGLESARCQFAMSWRCAADAAAVSPAARLARERSINVSERPGVRASASSNS